MEVLEPRLLGCVRGCGRDDVPQLRLGETHQRPRRFTAVRAFFGADVCVHGSSHGGFIFSMVQLIENVVFSVIGGTSFLQTGPNVKFVLSYDYRTNPGRYFCGNILPRS